MIDLNYNILLEYWSYFKTGSKVQFYNSLANIDYENKINNEYDRADIIRMFSRLAHIEFDYINENFTVCEPTLVIDKFNQHKGFLAGYRTKEFLQKLKKSYVVNRIGNYNAPDKIEVLFNDIEDFKTKFPDIRISEDFSSKILTIIPDLETRIKNLRKTDMNSIATANTNIYNTTHNTFNKYDPRKEYQESIKLFEIVYFDHREYFLDKGEKDENDDGVYYEIDKESGKFYLQSYYHPQKNILKFSNGKLYVNKYYRLPELLDRCLTMLSGLNIDMEEKNFISYNNINLDFAQSVAKILGTTLEVENG